MAHGRQEFALVGYSPDLERRPLKFVDPIPASRVCSSCGNVPRLTLMLLCGHTFCEPCYKSFATTSECVCPLDGDVCVTEDVVTSKEYPAEQLLMRMVHCWNESNGCGVVLPASQIAEHVRHDCQHHVTRCPTCSAAVLSRDVCAHLKYRCRELVLHATPEAQPKADVKESVKFVVFEKKLEQRVRELGAKLAQLSSQSGSQNDRLVVEFCHNINNLKEALVERFEALTRQFEMASVQSRNSLTRNEAQMKALVAEEKSIEQRVGELDTKLAQLSLNISSQSGKFTEISHNNENLKKALTDQFGMTLDGKLAEMKAIYAEKCESLRATLTSVMSSVPISDTKTHQRVLTGYAALKEEARKDGWTFSMSDKVYLRRYLMTWGISVRKDDESGYIALRIELHEGREDETLDWPFTKELKLSIIHPETRQERLMCDSGCSSESNKKFFSRPIGGSNQAVRFDDTRVESDDIEREGYVKGDQLLLRFQVL